MRKLILTTTILTIGTLGTHAQSSFYAGASYVSGDFNDAATEGLSAPLLELGYAYTFSNGLYVSVNINNISVTTETDGVVYGGKANALSGILGYKLQNLDLGYELIPFVRFIDLSATVPDSFESAPFVYTTIEYQYEMSGYGIGLMAEFDVSERGTVLVKAGLDQLEGTETDSLSTAVYSGLELDTIHIGVSYSFEL